MGRCALIAAAALVCATSVAAVDATIYLSPSGNDNNNGTSPASAVRTFYAAQSAVRAAVAAGAASAEVQVAAGSYFLDNQRGSLVFTAADTAPGGVSWVGPIGALGAAAAALYGGPAVPPSLWRPAPGQGQVGVLVANLSILQPPNLPPGQPWQFFSLVEGSSAGVLARLPKAGSGYLQELQFSNTDNSLCWPPDADGLLPPGNFSVADASVFCNIGANWFSETRRVTSVNRSARCIHFEGATNAVGTCNDRVFLQGLPGLVANAGEFAFDSAAGLLYYRPRDAAGVLSGTVPVVVCTAPRVLDISGAEGAVTATGVGAGAVTGLTFQGLTIIGSGFPQAYIIFPPGRQNDFVNGTKEGAIRLQNAANVTLDSLHVMHAGQAGVWIEGATQNVTLSNSWIEGSGFSGLVINGIYPGDGYPAPYPTAAASYVNWGHSIDGNAILSSGRRVGHGGAVWLMQAGNLSITRNWLKEAPRNAVGIYGVRFGAGAGAGQGVLPPSAYGHTLNFSTALDILHTRHITVAYNAIENCVRDTCDGGAVESWGVGSGITIHTNAVSGMDSGGDDGSWMNFLFSDDASHFQNVSSNIVYEVAGKGSEEATMQKSVGSVFENNVIAFSLLGHAANAQPYIEPAGNMVLSRNIFAYLNTTDGGGLDYSVNSYTFGTIANSSSLMTNPSTAAVYGFTPATTPSSNDPVLSEFDWNLWWASPAHNVSALANLGIDTHAVAADPQFAIQNDWWNLTVRDLVLQPTSPAYSIPGFRPIDVASIGLPSSFPWSTAGVGGVVARRNASAAIQAESYDRQRGLWHSGSFGIDPGTAGFHFLPGAWARYDRVDLTAAQGCGTAPSATTTTSTSTSTTSSGVCYFILRIDPQSATRTVSLAVNSPLSSSIVATFNATAATPPGSLSIVAVPLSQPLPAATGVSLFLLPDGDCRIDYFCLSTNATAGCGT